MKLCKGHLYLKFINFKSAAIAEEEDMLEERQGGGTEGEGHCLYGASHTPPILREQPHHSISSSQSPQTAAQAHFQGSADLLGGSHGNDEPFNVLQPPPPILAKLQQSLSDISISSTKNSPPDTHTPHTHAHKRGEVIKLDLHAQA